MSTVTNATQKRPIKSIAARMGTGAFVALVVALVWCCMIAGTAWAQMSGETETRFNVFGSRDVEITIVENDVPINADQATTSFGETSKRIALEIPANKSDAMVRLTFTPQIAAPDSTDDNPTYYFFNGGSMQAPVNNQVVMGGITLHFSPTWQNDWIFQDGFFHYRQVLKAGERTPDLLQGATITTAVEGSVEVVVSAEGLQPQQNAGINEWNISIE